MSIFNDQHEFMRLAEQTIDKPDESQFNRYIHHIEEEWNELKEADQASDVVATLDALADIIVVSAGALISIVGKDRAQAVFDAVHAANLRKVVGGRVDRSDGQIGKPAGWHGPGGTLKRIGINAGLIDEGK
jgi:predicted HAD superfamily Cof-like phosphohydrolase